MGEVNKFSERMIDLAERFADVVDAAQGNGARKAGPGARWLVLPAAGAAAYALATSGSSLARQTRGLMRKAKDRATDLPDADLYNRVKEVTGVGEERSSTSSSSTSSSRRKTRSRSQGQKSRSRAGQTQSRRKTASARS
jgi:hypothetical protein